VTTVVLKLFNLLPATHAYFGRKDYQQVLVIRQMAEDLAVPIRVVACDIVRDSDGLALSSRNRYLSDAERASALSIRKALLAVQEAVYAGETSTAALEQLLKNILDLNVSSIEYAVLADADTLSPSETVGLNSVALVAARVGSTRLIDNLVIAPPPSR
jgi:pantoate--beta-alanine ligase